MPSDAFLRSIGSENVQPVILMQVEQGAVTRVSVTTQDQWEACSLTNWDALSVPGSVVPSATVYKLGSYNEVARQSLSVGIIRGTYYLANQHGHQYGPSNVWVDVTVKRNGIAVGTYQAVYKIPRTRVPITFPVTFILPADVAFTQGDVIDVATTANHGSGSPDGPPVYHSGGSGWYAPPELVTRNVSGSLTTAPIDLGSAPDDYAVISFDDFIPPGASIAYTARGSSNGTSWTSLGTVTDGQQVSAYRYYEVTAAYSWAGEDYPEIREIRLTHGGSYLYYSTHRDEPFFGALPYLADKPISTLNSKIALMDKPSTGEASIKLVWNDHISALLAAGTLVNNPVSISVGAAGLPSEDYELIFTGAWHDYVIDTTKGIVTVKLRDVLKMYSRSKVPREATNATTGLRAVRPLVFTNRPVLSAILDISDAQGIPGRFLNASAFASLEAEGINYQVTRTISEPTEADKLLAELTTTAGIFVVPAADGKLTPIVYQPDIEPVATLDAREIDFGSIDGGQKDLRTRQIVYYAPIVADPGDQSEDYSKGLIYINADIEGQLMESEISEKRWHDKWNAPDAALVALAQRMNSWYATPHQTVTASKVPLRHMGINPGQVISVDNLQMPSATWPGLSVGRKFLVMGRDLDANSLSLKLSLFDLQTASAAGAGVAGTDLAISGSDTPADTINTYTVTGGTAPYTWESTIGILSNTVGSSVNLNVNDADGAGTISVQDATAKVTKRIVVAPRSVTNFVVTQQPDGTRQFSWTALSSFNISGYRLRYSLGTGGDWATMTALHSGVIPSSPYETNQLSSGTYTFSIRAVTLDGVESGTPAYIEASLPEQRGNYKIAQENAYDMEWPGTLTDARIDQNNYVAPADATTWSDMGTWAASSTWSPSPESPVIYEHSVIDIGAITAFTPVVNVVADGSVTLTMSYSEDNSTWSAWEANGFVSSARYYKQRVTVAGTRPTIYNLDILLSGKPVEDTIEDLATSSLTGSYRIGTGDIRLPYTSEFQQIRVVVVTLQNVGQGWTWELIDKDVTVGPRIKIYNASGNPADAVIDAYIRGL